MEVPRDRLLSKRPQSAKAGQTGREEGQRRRLGHRLIDYVGYRRQRCRSRHAASGVDVLSEIDLVHSCEVTSAATPLTVTLSA